MGFRLTQCESDSVIHTKCKPKSHSQNQIWLKRKPHYLCSKGILLIWLWFIHLRDRNYQRALGIFHHMAAYLKQEVWTKRHFFFSLSRGQESELVSNQLVNFQFGLQWEVLTLPRPMEVLPLPDPWKFWFSLDQLHVNKTDWIWFRVVNPNLINNSFIVLA